MAQHISQFGTKVVSSSRIPLPVTHLPHISVTDVVFTIAHDLLCEISSFHCEEGCCIGFCGFCYRTVADQYQRRTNWLHFHVPWILIRCSFGKFPTNLRGISVLSAIYSRVGCKISLVFAAQTTGKSKTDGWVKQNACIFIIAGADAGEMEHTLRNRDRDARFQVPASADEGSGLLGCFAMSTDKHLSTFRRRVMPSSSGSSSLTYRPTVRCNIPQYLTLQEYKCYFSWVLWDYYIVWIFVSD